MIPTPMHSFFCLKKNNTRYKTEREAESLYIHVILQLLNEEKVLKLCILQTTNKIYFILHHFSIVR
jgi:hypothetical protein